MAEITGRWKNQYAYEARRPKVVGLYLELKGSRYPIWKVQTGRTGSEQCKRGIFGFSKYGSGAAAYRAATEFLLTTNRLDNTRTCYKKKANAKQQDLPVGVSIYKTKNAFKCMAFMDIRGERMTRCFSTAIYGEEQAKAMAISQRKAWEEEFALKPEQPVVEPIQPYENNYEVVQI